jgi:HD-like signal output (HDOD) protein
MLGMNQIHDLSLAACLASTFERIPPGRMDMTKFWRNSMRRAVAARELARACGVMDRERLFVQGLLSDVGHMVMYLRIPDAATQLLGLIASARRPVYLIEREQLDCDWGQVGGALLKTWGLPPGIFDAVTWHADPKAYQPHALEAALLHLVASAMLADELGLNFEEIVVPDAWAISGLTREQLAETIADSEEIAKPILALFLDHAARAA